MTNERTYQVIIGVLILIVVIGGWFAFVRRSAEETGENAIATTSAQQAQSASQEMGGSSGASSAAAPQGASAVGASAASDAVAVADQKAGMSVTVQSLSLDQASWVAIRDASGRILGAGLFPQGEHADVPVPLLRATVAGDRYQVLLYADSGNKTFDMHADTLITSEGGSVAGTTFTAN